MNKWVINPKPSRLFLWTRGSSHSSHHHLSPPKSNAVTSKVEQTESNSNYDVAAKQMEQGCPTRCQFTLIGQLTRWSSGEGSVLSKAQIKPNPLPTTTFDGPMERWRCQTYSTSWAIHCDLKWANQSNTICLSLQRSLTKYFILV